MAGAASLLRLLTFQFPAARPAKGDFESVITVLRPLAEAGSRDAQYELGFLALTECDLISGREAFSLFTKAADPGHAEAMYQLATFPEFLSESVKSPLSNEEGWQWLLRAGESTSHEERLSQQNLPRLVECP